MRIGIDVTPLHIPYSGVGTYTSNLFQALQRLNGNEIVPLAPPEWLRRGSALRRTVLNKTMWMQAALPRDIRQLRLDVCHFTNFVAPLRSPCPTVLTIHDMTLWLFRQHHTLRRVAAMRPIIPLAARRADAIITVSESARADIISILDLDPAKVHVVYEAASTEFHPLPAEEARAFVRASYGVQEPYVLYVGTLEPRKNLVRLLEAYASLRHSKRSPHSLVLVGSRGWKEQPIFAAVERLQIRDAVHFIGHVPLDHLVALYNAATVLAFPSLYEGFGLPIVEAMACGTPVVTSPCGSLREIAGDAAELIDPLDVGSIADGLYHVACNPDHAAMLRSRGLDRASQFTWTEAARQTRQLYENVAGA